MTARRITELSDAQACLWEAQDEDATRPILDEYSAHTRRERRRAQRAEQVRRDAPCYDCGVDTMPPGDGAEYYMIKDEIWAAAGLPSVGSLCLGVYTGCYLCIGCLEHRISRRLTRADFRGEKINPREDLGWSRRSDRLIDRLSKP